MINKNNQIIPTCQVCAYMYVDALNRSRCCDISVALQYLKPANCLPDPRGTVFPNVFIIINCY